eukprot:gene1656-1024_t
MRTSDESDDTFQPYSRTAETSEEKTKEKGLVIYSLFIVSSCVCSLLNTFFFLFLNNMLRLHAISLLSAMNTRMNEGDTTTPKKMKIGNSCAIINKIRGAMLNTTTTTTIVQTNKKKIETKCTAGVPAYVREPALAFSASLSFAHTPQQRLAPHHHNYILEWIIR